VSKKEIPVVWSCRTVLLSIKAEALGARDELLLSLSKPTECLTTSARQWQWSASNVRECMCASCLSPRLSHGFRNKANIAGKVAHEFRSALRCPLRARRAARSILRSSRYDPAGLLVHSGRAVHLAGPGDGRQTNTNPLLESITACGNSRSCSRERQETSYASSRSSDALRNRSNIGAETPRGFRSAARCSLRTRKAARGSARNSRDVRPGLPVPPGRAAPVLLEAPALADPPPEGRTDPRAALRAKTRANVAPARQPLDIVTAACTAC
jgi:hypothetical protein